jgi:hypothetical protein
VTYLDTPGQEVGERSEDGQYEWDGEEWVPTADAIYELVNDLTDELPPPPLPQVGERSEDEQFEWDGEEWVPTADAIDDLVNDLTEEVPTAPPLPEIGQRSEDEQYEWDGEEWAPTAGALDELVNELAEEMPAPPRPEVGERSEDGLWEWNGNEWAPTAQAVTDLVSELAEEWTPDERALGDASDGNQAALKETPDGGRVGYQVGGFMLLIGDNHPPHYFEYVQTQRDHAQGEITIEKGGFRSAGSLLVTGCPPAKQGVVEGLISEFSKKKVRFQ